MFIQKEFQDLENKFSVFTNDLDIPKLFPFDEEQHKVIGSLINPRSSTR